MNEQPTPTADERLTVQDVAFLAGIRPRLVQRMIRLELIRPVRREPEPQFAPEVVDSIRKLLRLHLQLGVSWSSMAVVLDLMERVEKLESRLGNLDDSAAT